MRRIIKEFTPPVLITVLHAIRSLNLRRHSLLSNYGNKILVETVIWKNIQFKKSLISSDLPKSATSTIMAVALALKEKNSLKVLDFGGGGGNLHTLAEKAFPQIDFDWTVVETPEMVNEAKLSLTESRINFVSEIPNITSGNIPFDLVIASGSLQYVEDPLKTLSDLINLKPNYIFISRTPLNVQDKSLSYQQKSLLSANGPIDVLPDGIKEMRIKYRNNVVPKEKFLTLLTRNFEIQFAMNEGEWDASLSSSIVTMTYFAGSIK